MAFTLFHSDNGFDVYRNEPKIVKMLNGCKLLNHQEFIQCYKPPSPREQPIRTSTTRRKSNISRTIVETTDIAFDILDTMANDVCKGEIGEEYGKRAIELISKDFAGKK